MRQLLVAKGNAARILNIDSENYERERTRTRARNTAHEI